MTYDDGYDEFERRLRYIEERSVELFNAVAPVLEERVPRAFLRYDAQLANVLEMMAAFEYDQAAKSGRKSVEY